MMRSQPSAVRVRTERACAHPARHRIAMPHSAAGGADMVPAAARAAEGYVRQLSQISPVSSTQNSSQADQITSRHLGLRLPRSHPGQYWRRVKQTVPCARRRIPTPAGRFAWTGLEVIAASPTGEADRCHHTHQGVADAGSPGLSKGWHSVRSHREASSRLSRRG